MNTKYFMKSSSDQEVTSEMVEQVETFMNLLLNSKKTKITLLDYYRNVQIEMDSFQTLLQKLNYSRAERNVFSKFSHSFGYTEVEKSVEFFLNDSFKYGYRKYLDEKDRTKFIDIIMSSEDKKEVLEYFIENEIPLYTSLFYIAAKEKLEGTLYDKEVGKQKEKHYSV